MNDSAQRIAIAEALGWDFLPWGPHNSRIKIVAPKGHVSHSWSTNDPENSQIRKREHIDFQDEKESWAHAVPDYVGSLDAIHDAELSLNHEQHRWFCNHLREACGSDAAISANAEVRAKCFLKAKNLWTGLD